MAKKRAESKSVKPKPDAEEKAKKKSEEAEVARRVEEILRIRLDGAQYHDVVQYAAEKGWDLKERQLREYMARADNLLVERLDKNRKPVIARHLAQRQALFARAIKAEDFRTALAVLDSEAKIRGLYPEKEFKELLKLAAAQETRIKQLETQQHAPDGPTTPTPTPLPGRQAGGPGADPPG